MSVQLAVILAAFAIGVTTGLRSLTPPAVVSWAAYLGWIHLDNSRLAFLSSKTAVLVLSLLALGELVADKLPFIPNRTAAGPLLGRIIAGGIVGAALCISTGQSATVGAVAGAVGGISGAFGGFHLRRYLVHQKRIPDFLIALLEDIVAVGGSLLLASRF